MSQNKKMTTTDLKILILNYHPILRVFEKLLVLVGP